MSEIKKLNPDVSFVLQLSQFIKFLFNHQVYPFLIGFSFVFLILPINIYIFIIFKLLITMMAYKIAFDTLIGASKGIDPPQVIQNTEVSNVVSVKVLIVAVFFWGIKYFLEKNNVEQSYVNHFVNFSIVITPAIYMFIALTNSLIKSLNPVSLTKLVMKIPVSYSLLVIFWLLTTNSIEYFKPQLVEYLPTFFGGMLLIYLEFGILIVNFYIMGFILFQNGEKFGFDKLENKDDDFIIIQQNPIFLQVKTLISKGDFIAARNLIEKVKPREKDSIEWKEYVELIDSHENEISKGHNPNAVKINTLIKSQKIGLAANTLIDHFPNLDQFEAYDLTDIYSLAKYFHHSGKDNVSMKLLVKYCNNNTDHNDFVKNTFLKSQILYKNNAPEKSVKEPLWDIIKTQGNHKMIREIKSWLIGVNKIKRQP